MIFPIIFTNYKVDINYRNEEEKQCLIEAVAELISSIYATFLTAEGHEKRNKKLAFFDFPKKFPSAETVSKFQTNLKDEIVKELKKEDKIFDDVYLSTNYVPEKTLDKVLKKSEITYRNFDVNKLFPEKTGTRIYHYSKYKRIEVSMRGEKGY